MGVNLCVIGRSVGATAQASKEIAPAKTAASQASHPRPRGHDFEAANPRPKQTRFQTVPKI